MRDHGVCGQVKVKSMEYYKRKKRGDNQNKMRLQLQFLMNNRHVEHWKESERVELHTRYNLMYIFVWELWFNWTE